MIGYCLFPSAIVTIADAFGNYFFLFSCCWGWTRRWALISAPWSVTRIALLVHKYFGCVTIPSPPELCNATCHSKLLSNSRCVVSMFIIASFICAQFNFTQNLLSWSWVWKLGSEAPSRHLTCLTALTSSHWYSVACRCSWRRSLVEDWSLLWMDPMYPTDPL